MNEKNVKEAIECVKADISNRQKDFEQAGTKRLECYATYAIFYIRGEMETMSHLKILKEILKVLETASDPIDQLQHYQDYLKREVLGFRAPSSTSATSNLFEVIKHGVQLEYVRASYGQINSILRVLAKEE